MPLSEHEQRLLDQIERALYQEDPKFASTVRSSDLRTHMRRRLRRAGIVLAVGFVLLLAGVVTHPAVGVAGFLVMLAALLLALSSWRRLGGNPKPALRSVDGDGRPRERRPDRSPKPPKVGGSSGSLLGRLEERWNRRWDERGREQ